MKPASPIGRACPHCGAALTDAELASLWGSFRGSRQTPHAGPGRPRTNAKRCACGAMTAARAKKRGHVCER